MKATFAHTQFLFGFVVNIPGELESKRLSIGFSKALTVGLTTSTDVYGKTPIDFNGSRVRPKHFVFENPTWEVWLSPSRILMDLFTVNGN